MGGTVEVIAGGPGPAQPVPVPTTTTSQLVTGRGAIVYGWSLLETTGAAAASVEVYSGQDDTGTLLAVSHLASGDSDTQWMGDAGVFAAGGVYLKVTSGSVKGSVWVAQV